MHWRVIAEIPESHSRRRAKLILDEGGARVVISDKEYAIPREEVAKVYVFRDGLRGSGLCFQMKDIRDYALWIRGGRAKAEEALWMMRKAQYSITRTIYKPYYGRLDRG